MKNIRNMISLVLVIVFAVFVSNYDESTQAAATISQNTVSVSGESFGIKMHTQGVLVISTAAVQTENGEKHPAGDLGLRAGDVITQIDGKEVKSCAAVSRAIEASGGKELIITLRRENEEKSVALTPVLCKTSGTYKAGLWIRDSTAGIGTVTFYDSNGNFGALGHGVTDVDTQTLLPLRNGEAVQSEIIGFSKAQKGAAGELYGVLTKTAIGSITKNTAGGVYGKSDKSLKHLKSYPVAQPKEVRRGKATVLTTVDERGVQAFEVNIQFINIIGTGYKDMIVKVTDEKLLEKTGGILQGMSGSPIIQNGKFVGALTHVFLNRPELGYAVFGYKMVNLAKQ
ncbi:MAG: SpoIVB peptidase [Ruminococcaceae bacterium]|nr:SpoIVB peptidase [Oscillospiraceae bacterium]